MYDVPSVAYLSGQTIVTKFDLPNAFKSSAQGASCYLDNYEAGATTVSTLEVDGALIMRDVEALYGVSLLERSCACKGKGKKRGEESDLHRQNQIANFLRFGVCGEVSVVLSSLDRFKSGAGSNKISGWLYMCLSDVAVHIHSRLHLQIFSFLLASHLVSVERKQG